MVIRTSFAAILATLLLLLEISSAALHRRVWIESLTGQPFWEEGDPFPTSNEEANRFLTFTKVAYNAVFDSVGATAHWNAVPDILFGVVDSKLADLQGLRGPCTYGDAYFTADKFGSYGSVFCPQMATAFWVGHEWGHGYAAQAGLRTATAETWAISEFVADVLGVTVQILADPQEPSKRRRSDECSVYGENPGFGYIQGTGGTDESKRWVVGVNCESEICPTRDMWNPTCFDAADRILSPNYLCGEGANEASGLSSRAHKNDGVGNKFFALLVDGGSFNGQNIQSIGLAKSFRVVYGALLSGDNLGPDPSLLTFRDMASALMDTCVDSIGEVAVNDLQTGEPLQGVVFTSEDCDQVSAALKAVEMYEEPCVDQAMTFQAPSSPVSFLLFSVMPIAVLLLI
jgi:hypothetical protein